jgi:hypothetical protein
VTRLKFTQRDLMRAVKSVLAAGLAIARLEIDPTGKIVIITGKPAETEQNINPWDAKP